MKKESADTRDKNGGGVLKHDKPETRMEGI